MQPRLFNEQPYERDSLKAKQISRRIIQFVNSCCGKKKGDG